MILFLVACAEEGDGGPGPIRGVLTSDRAGEQGEVDAAAAWGFAYDGTGLVFVSPNPAATCSDVVIALTGDADEDADWDPDSVYGIGQCSIFMLGPYDGASATLGDETTITFTCAMDDGEWTFEDRGVGGRGWYYDGAWWQGAPTDTEGTLSGGEGDLALRLKASRFHGSFPYDSDESDASGELDGGVDVGWCGDLGLLDFF